MICGFHSSSSAEGELTYTVTTTAETGPGSLNEAIATSIYNIPFNTIIRFNIPGSGPHVIRPEKPINACPSPVIIDGTTQPGYEGTPLIILDGSAAGSGASGLKFFWTGESTVRGLSIHSFSHSQVQFDQKGGNVIEDCWIGVDAATGKVVKSGAHGIYLFESPGNRIGGPTPEARNLIAGPRFGITIEGETSRGNIIQGNHIGLDFACASAPGFAHTAITLIGAGDNLIGGAEKGQGNVIAGAPLGLVITNEAAAGNRIIGNRFGLDPAKVPAMFSEDIHILLRGANNTVIGGDAPGEGNIFGPAGRQAIAYEFASEKDQRIAGNTFSDQKKIVIAQASARSADGATLAAGPTSEVATLGAEVTVTNVSDSGAGSLRNAIAIINGTFGGGTILFNIAGSPPFTIQPFSAYPEFTQPVIIDGTSQPGHSGAPLIEINGNFAGASVDGFKLTAGPSVVKGLCINRFSGDACVNISGVDANAVQGCYLGVSITGETVYTRKTNHGVFVWNSANNLIGGEDPNTGNLIAGNIFGVTLEGSGSTGNFVQGNLIGTTIDGEAAPGNEQNGVFILGAPGNTIGGTTPAARNVICGNQAGLVIDGPSASGNLIQGNLIGTTPDNVSGLGNTIHGVFVIGAPGNTIGATTAGGRNIISANQDFGLTLEGAGATGNTIINNWIGVALNGSPLGNTNHGIYILQASNNTIGANPLAPNIIAYNGKDGVLIPSGTGNVVRANSIHSHSLLGIDLGDGLLDPDGVTENDEVAMDADTGPNLRQNFPKIMTISADTRKLTGVLVSAPNQTFVVEFFANAECNPSGHGEGQRLVGSVTVMTNAMGSTIVDTTLSVIISNGEYLTATATDSQGNTSEFSQCLPIGAAGAQGYFMY